MNDTALNNRIFSECYTVFWAGGFHERSYVKEAD